ncbi:MAG: SDR family oxidoreductase [Burkholderiaceae bacterium]
MSSPEQAPAPISGPRPGVSIDARGCKAALVTGAGKRLGREIAIGLAERGWDIAVHYHRSADAAEQTVQQIVRLGRRAIAVQADLSNPEAVASLFTAASALPLRAVINSASHFEHDTPASFEAAHLQAHLGPNLAAPVQLAQCLHRWLADTDRGAVINILDQKLDSLNPDFFSYTLTKQALLGATRMMAMSLAPKLRVVGVSPGLTLPSYLQTEAEFAQAHQNTALLDTSSTAADIVQTVAFMLDSPAITGVNLTVDGGQHLLGLQRDVSYLNNTTPTQPG